MKTFSQNFYNNIIATDATTIATCFRLELQNGNVLGFTTSTRDVVFNDEPNLIYKTASASKTAFSSNNNLAIDNIDAVMLLDHEDIIPEDLERGFYDGAKIRVFRFNYMLKPYQYSDIEELIEGTVGDVVRNKSAYNTTFESKTAGLQNTVTRVVTPLCSATFCDVNEKKNWCKLNASNYTVNATIIDVVDNTTFTIDISSLPQVVDHYLAYGNCTFTSGNAVKKSISIKDNTAGLIKLQLPLENYSINIGDTVSILIGCDKKKDTCKSKFNNLLNFRGFSFVPGQDNLTSN